MILARVSTLPMLCGTAALGVMLLSTPVMAEQALKYSMDDPPTEQTISGSAQDGVTVVPSTTSDLDERGDQIIPSTREYNRHARDQRKIPSTPDERPQYDGRGLVNSLTEAR